MLQRTKIRVDKDYDQGYSGLGLGPVLQRLEPGLELGPVCKELGPELQRARY